MASQASSTRYAFSLLVSLCAFFGAAASSHGASVTYALLDLRFTGPADQNGWPLPLDILEPGVAGHFTWSYADGDFSSGTGLLLDIMLPITPIPLSMVSTTADLGGLSGTAPGNPDHLAYDFVIKFAPALSGPSLSSVIDAGASTFDFSGSYMGSSYYSEWTGNISGTVSPVPEPDPRYLLLLGLVVASCAAGRAQRTAAARSPSGGWAQPRRVIQQM